MISDRYSSSKDCLPRVRSALVIAVIGCCGCVTDGGSVSMSSNSPMPWFGIGFAPKDRNQTQHREIRRDNDRTIEAQPIPLTKANSRRSAAELQPKKEAATKEASTSSRPFWWPRLELPRRDQTPLVDDESIPIDF